MNQLDSPSLEHASNPKKPAVVGLGASAGGLAALKAFFAHVPADSGLSFVVVVHLSPEHESHLPTLLQPFVKMPVQQVTETTPLEPNYVYVIPPNANINSIDTHLRLSELEANRQERAPIDHFLRTLAKSHDGHAIGVILSGTGSDGTLGMKDIKEKGGLTIVQDPNETEYDGMPQSAIATGLIDLVLPLAKIPAAILSFTQTEPRVTVPDTERVLDLQDDEQQLLQKIFAHLRARTGRDFSRYKRSTIMRRITRRMQIANIEELAGYLDRLRGQSEEVNALADDLLITVTSFFRDPEVFQKIEDEIIPQLFEKGEENDEIRIWSVGCATGEEAYSLAILLVEEAARREVSPRIQVFASDLHEESLKKAREGFYPGDIATDVSGKRLKRFFVKESNGYRVRKEIRELVVFAPHNLLGDPPFSRLDLISCRNLLIYLQRNIQKDVVDIFHYALKPTGYLVLGPSESLETADLFQTADKKLCIFRKRNVPGPEPRLLVFPPARIQLSGVGLQHRQSGEPIAYGPLHQRLVERYAPPSLLLSPDDKVVHLSQHAGRYLVHPGGEMTANVFKLVREELRIELRAALHTARKKKQVVISKPILVQFNGEAGQVVLHVRPALEPEQEDFALIIFDERPAGEAAASSISNETASGDAQARISELEAELNLTRQRLQSIIEEYETSQEEMQASNEEMQSTNEELRSTMEELETSKEELQSINEELQTVNQENRHKVEELAQLSGDLQNLLAATDIATLFLDRELRIMRFTPQVGDLFNVRRMDRGRPLADLTHRLGSNNLIPDAQQVLERLIPIEREIRDIDGQCYLTRLLPYRSSDDRIAGVVITFVDITRRKQAEEALRQSEVQLSVEVAAMRHLHELVARLLISSDLQTALEEILMAAIEITDAEMGNIQRLNPANKTLEIVAQRGFKQDFLDYFHSVSIEDASACAQALAKGQRVIIEDVQIDPSYKVLREVAASAGYRAVQSTPLISRTGDVLGMLSSHYPQPHRPSERDLRLLDLYARQAADFIERVNSEAALHTSEKHFREIFETAGVSVWVENFSKVKQTLDDLRAQGIEDLRAYLAEQPEFVRQAIELVEIVDVNSETVGLFEAETKADLLGSLANIFLPETDAVFIEELVALAEGRETLRAEVPLQTLTGRPMTMLFTIHFGPPDWEYHRVVVTLTDITAHKQAEEVLQRSKEELEQRVAERTLELAEQNQRLRQLALQLTKAEQMERRRITQVLHDGLQQLLVGAKMQLPFILTDEAPNIVKRLGDILEEAQEVTRSLTYELSPPALYDANLVEALQWLTEWFQSHHRFKVTLKGQESLPKLPEQLKVFLFEAIRELLLNAVKHSGANTATVTLHPPQDSQLAITVADEGIGFDSSQLEYQGEELSGFGLFSIRERLIALGGHLQIDSISNDGASIVLTVPVTEDVTQAKGLVATPSTGASMFRSKPSQKKMGQPVRLLIVDDHTVIREELAILLEREADLEVIGHAGSGLEALEQAGQLRPDVVIMDLEMPEVDGVEATRRLKELYPEIEVIGLSLHNSSIHTKKMRQAGATAHFSKGSDIRLLIKTIRNLAMAKG